MVLPKQNFTKASLTLVITWSEPCSALINEDMYLISNNIRKEVNMTRNQLAYWELRENKRAHRSQEAETKRANLAREAETHRNNLAVEQETNRANLARERQNAINSDRQNTQFFASLAETKRANQEREKISYAQLKETNRSNLANEQIARYNAISSRMNVLETMRTNQAKEAQSFLNYTESVRSNKAKELIQRASLSETRRSNIANEDLRINTLQETIRSNKAREDISRFGNVLTLQNLHETTRHNRVSEAELNRHNLASEMTERVKVVGGLTTNLLTTLNKSLSSVALGGVS